MCTNYISVVSDNILNDFRLYKVTINIYTINILFDFNYYYVE